MQRRIIILLLALSCGLAQARVIALKAPHIISVVNHVMAHTASTSAPPASEWFTPTNGQSVASLAFSNAGACGNGWQNWGLYTNRGAAAAYQSVAGKTNGLLAGEWMNGATQLTMLMWVFSSDAGGGNTMAAGRGNFALWNIDFVRIIMGGPGNRFYGFCSQKASGDYIARSLDISAAWHSVGYTWDTAGGLHTYVDGVLNDGALSYEPTTTQLTNNSLPFTFGHIDSTGDQCWYSDILATTQTLTAAQIGLWHTNTAEATYNSNWPSLFTGDVEVTWREWSTNAP